LATYANVAAKAVSKLNEKKIGIQDAMSYLKEEVDLKPLHCDGYFYNSDKKNRGKTSELHAEAKKVCQSSLGPKPVTATDSPHALKIPIVFKVTKCAKPGSCRVEIAGWGMFKDWRSAKQRKYDKAAKKYDQRCGEIAERVVSVIPTSASRKQNIKNSIKQQEMCSEFRNFGWDASVRETIAKIRFNIARN